MKGIRVLMCLTIAALALAAPMMMPGSASADVYGHGGFTPHTTYTQPCVTYRTVCVYDVYYWDCHCHQWIAYGTYNSQQASFAISQLQARGYQTTYQQRHITVPVHH